VKFIKTDPLKIMFSSLGNREGAVSQAFRLLGPDRMVVFTSENMREIAYELEAKMYNNFSIMVKTVIVDQFDLMDNVNKAIEAYGEELKNAKEKGYPGIDLSINMTGGTKLMSAAMLLTGYILKSEVYYIQGDEKMKPEDQKLIQAPLPRVFLDDLNEQKREILRTLSKYPNISLKDLSERVNMKSTSALKRHTDYLEDQELIVGQHNGREKHLKLTNSGQLLVNIVSVKSIK
jgi:DNA-binding MarR family transcriptional regulator